MIRESNNFYEFGEFRLDGGTHRLWHGQELIFLSPKAFDLLKLLLERDGDFVSKDEIFGSVWAETFVEDGVLTQNIYTLRKALGNGSNGQPLIENKTRLGYRITVPVTLAKNGFHFSETNQDPNRNPDLVNTSPTSEHSKNKFGNWRKAGLFFALSTIFLSLISFLTYRSYRTNIASFFSRPIERVKFSKATNTGDLTNATISPDGSLMALTRKTGFFLRDIATGKEIKVDIQNSRSLGSLQFSPDGNFLYFRNDRILSTRAEIHKVSRFGGETQMVVERSWGSFSVSPDGKKIAYFINVPPIGKFNLRVRNLETGTEKEYFAAEQPQSPCLICAPAWSPDSSKIIFSTNIPTGTGQMFVIDVINDKRDELKLDKLRRFEQAAWLPNGKSFVVSATDGSRFFQLWKASYPTGETEPLTAGLLSFGKVSISSDGKKVLALQTSESSNLFVANSENLSDPQQLTVGDQNRFGQNGLHWLDDQRILYSTQTEQNLADNLAILNIDDSSRISITNEKQDSFRTPISDGKRVWFAMTKNGSAHIFQMDADGRNISQLTNGADGQRQSPRVTTDSKYLYYVLRGKDGSSILRFDLQNQTEEVFFNNPEFQPGPFLELSPDNKYLTFIRLRERSAEMDEKSSTEMTVVSVENTGDIKLFSAQFIPPIRRFSPDSKSIEYIDAETDGTQIVRQRFDGTTPEPIYTSSEGEIFNFAWSKNGKYLAVARGKQSRDAVLLSNIE